MTVTPTRLRQIAAARAALTATQRAALLQEIRNRTAARSATWEAQDSRLEELGTELGTVNALVTSTSATKTTLAASLASRQSGRATLEGEVAALQAQVALGGPPATAADVEERDQVVALAGELGITIP